MRTPRLPSKSVSVISTHPSPLHINSNLIHAAVRVRPPLKAGEPGFELIPQRFRNATCHVTSPSSLAVDASGGRKVFIFDRVFAEDVEQDGIFEYVTDSINSFVQGYNVSVLAYGQSGAGKSYTMGTTGPSEQADAEIMGTSTTKNFPLKKYLTCSLSIQV